MSSRGDSPSRHGASFGTWQIETDPNKTSEWEVRFIAEAANRTRVELEHRKLERHGDGWQGVRDGVARRSGLATLPAALRRAIRRRSLTAFVGSRNEPSSYTGVSPGFHVNFPFRLTLTKPVRRCDEQNMSLSP